MAHSQNEAAQNRERQGNWLAAFSFVLWGIMPLYYQLLPNADVDELLAFRVLFSVPVMLMIILLMGRRLPSLSVIWADKKSLFMCTLAALLMCVSWYSFTWALTHERVLEASLGFFINPLIAIALGVLVLKDKLSLAQKWAVVLGLCGIGYQVVYYGQLPWLSIVMGSFFAFYGLAKKYVKFDVLTSVLLEALVLMPFAAVYLVWLWEQGESIAINGGLASVLLYMGSAPVTLAPLLFFALAISRTRLSMIGLMQYIEPSLQFLLAVLVFGELLDSVKLVSFSFIWLGLGLCALESLPFVRRARGVQPIK